MVLFRKNNTAINVKAGSEVYAEGERKIRILVTDLEPGIWELRKNGLNISE